MCVQRFDDSRKSAIHNTYRISLRSSSLREPRDPLLKVLKILIFVKNFHDYWLKVLTLKKMCLDLWAVSQAHHPKQSSKKLDNVCKVYRRAIKRWQ